MKPLYEHQQKIADFSFEHPLVLNTSDPGTGKTRATLEGFFRHLETGEGKRLLVVAPLSILKPSWGDDITTFFPQLRYAIATAPDANRRSAFATGAEIVIINTDGIKWVAENPEVLTGFTHICIDEFTSLKNKDTQRSKAALKVCRRFKYRTLLSGTPNPNSLTDLWHPVYLLDGGSRLGSTFSKFRSAVCLPVQNGPRPEHIKWVDRPGMSAVVSGALADITIRFTLEDCITIPEHSECKMHVDMSKKVMKAYRAMEADSVLMSSQGNVNAVNAAVRVNKMLQILSGAVYGEDGARVVVDNSRYQLIAELVEARDYTVVAFNWQHEKEGILAEMTRRGLAVAVLDGKTPVKQRTQAIEDFQEGKLRAILCHPQASAHGITLTRGATTIWASPTYSSELFTQLNRRIYRAGQTQKTQTIMICARDSREELVYDALGGKMDNMKDLLGLLTGVQEVTT